MAKPNYAFEKRQRERVKKEKKAEKAAQRKPGSDKPDEQPIEGSDAPKENTAAMPAVAAGR